MQYEVKRRDEQDDRGSDAEIEHRRSPRLRPLGLESEVRGDLALDAVGQTGGGRCHRRPGQLPLQGSFSIPCHGLSSSTFPPRASSSRENALCSRLRIATVVISSIAAISLTARPPQKCAITVKRRSSGSRSTAARSCSPSSVWLSTSSAPGALSGISGAFSSSSDFISRGRRMWLRNVVYPMR